MSKRSSKDTRRTSSVATSATPAVAGSRSLASAKAGIRTGQEFAACMSGLMSDVIQGKVSVQVVNAACNAGGKLLKIAELQHKYGVPGRPRKLASSLIAPRDLSLTE